MIYRSSPAVVVHGRPPPTFLTAVPVVWNAFQARETTLLLIPNSAATLVTVRSSSSSPIILPRVKSSRMTIKRLNKTQGAVVHVKKMQHILPQDVITGGKTKYLINGVSANNNRVHDLFQSVQLNVNNPHFLIMQGRITKVLNMKPLEILSMIEEAAGTRMYEEKKETALKNLEKKDSKLREINAVIIF
ncbi:UNVERIFIED_CONTAM: Structural maintenance of chromosomes protein 2-2 [Trichonephila clavipes]